MNLIITGGNSDYFNQLKLFVKSLRERGNYKGIIAICDNDILGTSTKPGNYRNGKSFTQDQERYLKSYDAKIYQYSELLKNSSFSKKEINSLPSYTKHCPHKFIYNALITKQFQSDVDKICYFDADVYFQKDILNIFDCFDQNSVYIVKGNDPVKNCKWTLDKLKQSDFSRLYDQSKYIDKMKCSENFCTGFYGGTTDNFHKFVILGLLLSINPIIKFFSDQPTVNIVKTFFEFPIIELSEEKVRHLALIPEEEIIINGQSIMCKNIQSIAVHFNGNSRYIFERAYQAYFNEPLQHINRSILQRIIRRINI